MRLTFVSSSLGGGGAERTLALLASDLAGAGHQVCILLLRRDEHPFPYVVSPEVRLLRLGLIGETTPFARARNVGLLFKLRREIRCTRPDVVISFIDKLNTATVLALAGTHLPVVATEHLPPWLSKLSPPWQLLRSWAYSQAAAVVCPTERIRAWFRARTPGNFQTIPYPVSPPAASSEITRQPVVLSVGRLALQKRHDVAIKAFSKIAGHHPEWVLHIAGEGEARAELESLIRSLHMEERVRLLGFCPEIDREYAKASVFLLSSDFEAYPMVLCEAMAARLPSVVTDCPTGPRELITSGVEGFLVPTGDSDAVSRALDTLIKDSELRSEMGKAALKRARLRSRGALCEIWAAFLANLHRPT